MGSDGGRRLRPASEPGGDVMAAVDKSGPVATLIIADISADDAWVTTPADDAASLDAWR